jgi:osmoprotectant transport system ATP-binding protein
MSSVNRSTIESCAARFELNGRRIVGPLDFSVRSAETLALLGRSGSGKTTTLRLINGLLMPTAGDVRVGGVSTRAWEPVRLRRSVGYVIQEVGLFPHMSVRRNVGLVPELERWVPARIEARVDELLELVGLAHQEFADRLPHQLSGGQRQRVGVARALAADPPILLCDEPFGAVDPLTRVELQREFSALTRRLGKTVVFVTHDVREALRVADRIALIEEGRVAFLGTTDEFRSSGDSAVRAFRDIG